MFHLFLSPSLSSFTPRTLHLIVAQEKMQQQPNKNVYLKRRKTRCIAWRNKSKKNRN